MNIAITVWGNRISPVFDASQNLLIATIENGEVVGRRMEQLKASPFDCFQEILQRYEIVLLLCGAICEARVQRLESRGVEVVSFLTGGVEDILEHYISGEEFTTFAMPGCRIGGCCRMRSSTEGQRGRGARRGGDSAEAASTPRI